MGKKFSESKIMVGYWHNWPSAGKDGYQQGSSCNLSLLEVPHEYNVICVSFMKGVGIPTFKPFHYSDEEFRQMVDTLHSQNRFVLLSLGGADAHVELTEKDEDAFVSEVIRLVETYGFDGIDIDLEQGAIGAASNKKVIPAALKKVKDHYKAVDKEFVISMAPEFPYLHKDGSYIDYITALEGYYDMIAPQFYNQGGDGLWVDEESLWIAQNNDALKSKFLYYLTKSLVTGTHGFISIPPQKFAIGLPANIDAAATGYVINPEDVYDAFSKLANDGINIKGLMSWSINWDNGVSASGKSYDWEFAKRYSKLISYDEDNNDSDGSSDNNDSNHTPTAAIDLSVVGGDKFILLGHNGNPDNHEVLTFHWDVPFDIDGSTVTDDQITLSAPEVTEATVFEIKLTLTGKDQTSTSIQRVKVVPGKIAPKPENKAPVAAISFSVLGGSQFLLSASQSYSESDQKLTYVWDIPGGIDVKNKQACDLEIIAPMVEKEQQQTFSLVVMDEQGNTSQQVSYKVNIAPKLA